MLTPDISTTIYTATEECWVDLAVNSGYGQVYMSINKTALGSAYEYYFDRTAGFQVNIPNQTDNTTAIAHFPDNIGGMGNSSLGRFYLNVGEWFALATSVNVFYTYVAYTYKETS